MKRQKHKSNKNKKSMIICFSIFMSIYLGGSAYFINHFHFGTKINGINVTGKTVKQADELISSSISIYVLELQGRDGKNEEIKGTNIALTYNPKDKITNLKDSQNPLSWITSIFSNSHTKFDELVKFDETLLKEQINKLSYFDSKNIVKPKNAGFNYIDDAYEIEKEVMGNKIIKKNLYENIKSSFLKGDTLLNLGDTNSYENPKYITNSNEVLEAKKLLDKYTSMKITYTFGSKQETADGSIINKWLETDENMNVVFNEKKMISYITSLAREYNTFGNAIDFLSSSGKTIQVNGGNYGWLIDKTKEVKDLIEIIKNGQDVTKEPAYSQTAVSHDKNDIGNTYLEIDMTKQHVWFYKNGALVTEGDVVTGNLNNNCETPVGVCRLNYKERKATLKGKNYSAPVNFWLPFNGNIGLHDASWRDKFGGEIYKTSGSHGCVNAPYELANKIFDNIESGTPVVCYYEK
ncbi:L,D-transpeptidase family protein [Clostridium uliginosum]|uniref:Putative peptidoglycan binding domain-containing protein n=1 Tax=Clostridium uliginosum TaxID=119641 RepID=A0A1I1QTC6_9CLOT|nr:L,D-transpeptidase family protein [Clostridium uliginosum]SFD25384.1 Putative peptidoglycan binding domain-containing protein [Clostridium uliginosum]